MAAADIGVIGGSGFYEFLDDAAEIELETPYGPPSDPLVLGTVAGRRVAFLPRHGRDHRFPPHRIPYRANLWALRAAGVQQVLAPCAVGGLQPTQAPGDLVVPDQLVDRTSGRPQTYHDDWSGRGAVHVSFADPYCPTGRRVAVETARAAEWPVTDGGTMVVVEGPRFSTRAESEWYSGQGWSVINMTGHPEAVLARELKLCYTAIALVTDLDAGVHGGAEVSQEEIFTVFAEKTAALRSLLHDVVGALPTERRCGCAHDLELP
ncbi:MAG: methylthioadenosine phosphorylase [Frankiales bacterium]|nr:methylthioadenosine phosphorylase [Frankiales bacterium]